MRRYPGISPFEENQRHIFFGRDNDIKRLKTLIELRPHVLLYSKSGVGKTSLLNAGVLPLLSDKYLIVKVRFFSYDEFNPVEPVKTVITILKNLTSHLQGKTALDLLPNPQDLYGTFWYEFKRVQLLDGRQILLVFDQFEEIFTYPDEMIEKFKDQFYQLTSQDVPLEVMQKIEQKPELEETDEIDRIYEPVAIKSVFAIREDRLSLLNRLSDKLLDIQKYFYELKPLNQQQAREAIVRPAQKDGDFSSPKFKFTEAALQKVIDSLTDNGRQPIEATQLQIVCQKIEDIATNKAKTSEVVQITENDLPEFKDIFLNFYYDTVRRAARTEDEVQKIQEFIEDQLIREGVRISLDEVICKQYIDQQILDRLTALHLLRAEPNTMGRLSYELSHDTLVEPILQSRHKRLEEQRRLEELRRLQEQRRRQLRLIGFVSLLSFIFLSLAVFGFAMWFRATRLMNNLYNEYIRKAVEYQNRAEYSKAIEYYQAALQFKKNAKAPMDSIKICKQRMRKQNEFKKLIREAVKLQKQKLYVQAVKKYIQANQLGYKDITENILRFINQYRQELTKDLNDYKELGISQLIKYTQHQLDSLNILQNQLKK